MSPIEQQALAAIDMDALIGSLADLIALPSDEGQEGPIQSHLAELLGQMGLRVDAWDIDLEQARAHPAYGAEIERERASGLVASFGDEQGPALILNGHVDVVPAGDLDRWSVPPFEATLQHGRVYGRGAVDMKGGLCCAIEAVRAIQRAGIELAGTVRIQSVVGEEDGGLGTLAAILRGHRADAAIILEPTECVVAPAQAGAFSFRLSIPGQAAHGALRTEGVDPLEWFGPVLERLRQLEHDRNQRLRHALFSDYEIPYAICTGKVEAGIWASTVAESLVIEGRYGVGIDEDPAAARRELEQAIEAFSAADPWLREHPITLEWWGARFEPAAIAADHPLVTTLIRALGDLGHARPRVHGMPYGSDLHLLINQAGIPGVLFGPGDVRQAHVPDEYVPLADLERVTRALVLAILRFCGVRI